MAVSDGTDDVRAIEDLIGAHFDALRWEPGTRADCARFSADFLPDASLFPAARPARRQTLEGFIARMDGVAQGALRSFEEKTTSATSRSRWPPLRCWRTHR